MIFLYWIRNLRIWITSLNSVYTHQKKIKFEPKNICLDDISSEYFRKEYEIHKYTILKSKKQLLFERIFTTLVSVVFYGFIIYLFRRK
jgi:hypothetical protein